MTDLEQLRYLGRRLEQPSLLEAADEIARLHNLLRMPLSSAEMKLVDKNCDWIAFGHAWNAVIKSRLAALSTNKGGGPDDA